VTVDFTESADGEESYLINIDRIIDEDSVIAEDEEEEEEDNNGNGNDSNGEGDGNGNGEDPVY